MPCKNKLQAAIGDEVTANTIIVCPVSGQPMALSSDVAATQSNTRMDSNAYIVGYATAKPNSF